MAITDEARERRTIRNEQGALVLAAMMGENLTCTAMSERVVKLRGYRAVTPRTTKSVRTRMGETA